MSLFSRLGGILQAKTNALLDRAEDPAQMMDLSYEKMLSALQEAKTHVADVAAERINLESQIQKSQSKIASLTESAQLAVTKGRDDLAKQALAEKASESAKLENLQASHDALNQQEQKLRNYCSQLQTRIDNFGHEKEIVKAQQSAAQAQIAVTESLSGLGNQLGNAGDALRRAQEKTEKMTAKAAALDSMMQEGTLSDPLDPTTPLQKEIAALKQQTSVDDELAALKAQMGQTSGTAPAPAATPEAPA